jgi:hypothetical protein
MNGRNALLAVALWLLGSSSGQVSAAPASAVGLAEAFRSAVAAKDREAIFRLIHWEGVTAEAMAAHKATVGKLVDYDVTKVAPVPLPPDYRSEQISQGVRYRPNVKVLGLLEVTLGEKRPPHTPSMRMPYGTAGDQFLIAAVIQERIDQPGPPDRSLSVTVAGTTGADVPEFSGFCTYTVSGQVQRRELTGKSNLNLAFPGQSFQECSVRKTGGGGKIKLQVREGDTLVFESPVTESGEPIVYKGRPAG